MLRNVNKINSTKIPPKINTLYQYVRYIRKHKALNIRNGEGISQAIAKELKGELKQDVKLNLSVWNKIFDIVKEDKEAAVGHCQYQGGDKDIKDSKNYVVQSGNYELTKLLGKKFATLLKTPWE